MGVYPESFLAPMRNDVGLLLARIEPARPPSDSRLVKSAAPPAKPAPAHIAPPEGEGAHH
jgi:NADH-quinone oxidoreductase subunit M